MRTPLDERPCRTIADVMFERSVRLLEEHERIRRRLKAEREFVEEPDQPSSTLHSQASNLKAGRPDEFRRQSSSVFERHFRPLRHLLQPRKVNAMSARALTPLGGFPPASNRSSWLARILKREAA